MKTSLAVEAYLSRFNLREMTEEWLQHIGTVMPEDPLGFLGDLIASRRSGLGRLVTCENPWCGITVISGEYEEHLKTCRADKWTKCIRCDMRVEVTRVHQHRMHCHLVTCAQCGEFVFPRMLGLCPVAITQKASAHMTKFLTSDDRGRTSPLGLHAGAKEVGAVVATGKRDSSGSGILQVLQSAWRRRNARQKFSSLAFRMVWDIMEFARETRLARSSLFSSRCDAFGSQNSITARLSIFANQASGSTGVSSFGKRASLTYSTAGETELESSIRATHPFEAFVSLYENCFQQWKTVEYSIAKQLIQDATKLLTVRPLVVHMRTPPTLGGKVVVVGDLHGQLKDLLYIVNHFGFPSETLRYVFNGDFVDRGSYGCEVLLLIYALLCTFPDSVFINRGNHEDFKTNREYGFQEEVHAKYVDKGDELLSDMIKSYKSMPLVTVIDEKTLVLHGGLPRFLVPLSRLNSIGHIRDVPTVEQADEDETLLVDILWSDPVQRYKSRSLGMRHQGEHWRTSARGCGIEYVAGHTAAFLALNNLEFVIRSHEMVGGGYEMLHDEMCCTVFSASDYCGVSGNRGAVAVFSEGRPDATFHTWFLREEREDEAFEEEMPLSSSGQQDDLFSSPVDQGLAVPQPPPMAGGGGGTPLADTLAPTATSPSASAGADATTLNVGSTVGATGGGGGSSAAVPVTRKATLASLLSANQRDCLQEMHEMIWVNRYTLLSNFVHVDVEQTGFVSKVEWCEVLRKVLALDLPWYFVCPFLTEIGMNNGIPSVRYALFLNSVESQCGQNFHRKWVEQAIRDVFKSLELPDDIVPSGVLERRNERKRKSHAMESFDIAEGSPPLLGQASEESAGGAMSAFNSGGNLAPKPPQGTSSAPASRTSSLVLTPKPPQTDAEDGSPNGARRARPSVNFAENPSPPPLKKQTSNMNGSTASTNGGMATSLSGAIRNASCNTSSNGSGSWRAVKVNFNYFVSTLRAKSPVAAQLEDSEIYVLFRFFDGDFDGHILLGDLADIVEIYCEGDDGSDEDGSDASSCDSSLESDDDAKAMKKASSSSGSGSNAGEGTRAANDDAVPLIITKRSKKRVMWIYPSIMLLQKLFFSSGQHQALQTVFRQLDKDKNGVVDAKEFGKVFRRVNNIMSTPLDDEQMLELFRCVDSNDDGCISLAEFLDYFTVKRRRHADVATGGNNNFAASAAGCAPGSGEQAAAGWTPKDGDAFTTRFGQSLGNPAPSTGPFVSPLDSCLNAMDLSAMPMPTPLSNFAKKKKEEVDSGAAAGGN